MLGGHPGQRIARNALQEALQVGVAVRRAIKKRVPSRTYSAWDRRGDARAVIGSAVRLQTALAQVNPARRGVQRHQVLIPLVDSGDQSSVSPRQALDGAHRLGAGENVADVVLVALGRCFSTDVTSAVERKQRVIQPLVCARVGEPSAQSGDIPKILRMSGGEAKCQCFIGEGRRALGV